MIYIIDQYSYIHFMYTALFFEFQMIIIFCTNIAFRCYLLSMNRISPTNLFYSNCVNVLSFVVYLLVIE